MGGLLAEKQSEAQAAPHVYRGNLNQRVTTTGILEWASTRAVSLPRISPPSPPRPCDAIAIASHFWAFAALRIPCQGCSAVSETLMQRTPAARASRSMSASAFAACDFDALSKSSIALGGTYITSA